MGDRPLFVTVEDYEPVARERLSSDVYGYIAGGAGDERTLADNVAAFARWIIRPRFLRGVGDPDPSTQVLGTSVSFPVLIAPWAYQRMAHDEGEFATARAASTAGTIMVASSTAVDVIEELGASTVGPKWWQLYVAVDRGFTAEMLGRVRAAGFGAICWTVDFPANGLRHRDTRSGFVMPLGLEHSDYVYDSSLTWDDLPWIKERSGGLPVLVKGILTAADAILAVEAGADGVVVSNHGGRQLDRSPASLDALPEVVDAVGDSFPVLMDGGVRRGVDVLTAIALGARAVLVGRPCAWGLAADGEQGVAGVLEILRAEFENAMALSGCRTVAEVSRELVAPATR